MQPLDKQQFMSGMELSESKEGSSKSTIKRFWDWMYADLDGHIQVCAFGNPVEKEEETITPGSKWKHVNTFGDFETFCSANSGLWTYQVYSGVNALARNPTDGRGGLDEIDRVNHVTFDLETSREAYAGATKREVWWVYQLALRQMRFMYEEYDVLPLVVMSENGIHLHYKADFPITDDLLYNKQHSYSKYITHQAMNCDYVKELKEELPDDIQFGQDDVSDPARVMKVPGTMGQKSDSGRMCAIIHEPPHDEAGTIHTSDVTVPKAVAMEYEKNEKNTVSAKKAAKVKDVDLNDTVEKRLENVKKADPKFRALFNGNLTNYESRSEAEYALIIKMLSHSFSPGVVPQLMWESGMSKWDEEDDHYREKTIESALSYFDGTSYADSTTSSLDFETFS